MKIAAWHKVGAALDRLAARDVSSEAKNLDWLCWEKQAALLLEVFEKMLAERATA